MLEKSAGCVLFYREKKPLFLLLKYGLGHWGFVKGHIEENETPIEAMLRELEEETGIRKSDVKVFKGFEEKVTYFFSKEGEKVRKEVIFFLAESKTKEVRLSYEHKAYLWLPYEEALKKLTFDNVKEVLKKANNFLKQRSLWQFG